MGTSVSPWYTGGSVERPSYHAVGNGGTGHREAVQILYDPTRQGGVENKGGVLRASTQPTLNLFLLCASDGKSP
jgi:hypothetical protein